MDIADFVSKYNDSATGLFKAGQNRGINSLKHRTLISDLEDTFVPQSVASLTKKTFIAEDQADDGTDFAAAYLINRILLDDISSNGHGFRDRTEFQRDTFAYASFDAQSTFNDNKTFDHYAAFQSRGKVDDNSILNLYYSLFSKPEVTAGSTIVNRYGGKIEDYTGAGAITTQYGLYIDALTKATNNWAIYSDGANTKSLHKGHWGIGALAAAPAYRLEVVDDAAMAFSLERQNAATNIAVTAGQVKAKSTGNMADGFGALLALSIQDDTSGTSEIGYFGAIRSGADSSGDLVMLTVTAGVATKQVTVRKEGSLRIHNLPTSSAGLPSGTLWNDTGTIKVA